MTSVSESHTVKLSEDMLELIEHTRPMREIGLYFAELREWSELPFYKRVFRRKPTQNESEQQP